MIFNISGSNLDGTLVLAAAATPTTGTTAVSFLAPARHHQQPGDVRRVCPHSHSRPHSTRCGYSLLHMAVGKKVDIYLQALWT